MQQHRNGFAACGHRVQFYDDENFLLKKVSTFVDTALDDGGAIVIATRPHLERLETLLQRHGGERWEARSARLVRLDARETLDRFMVDGLPDEERFRTLIGRLLDEASDGGRRPVGAFGEMVALLYAEGNGEAAVRLEHLWEGLTRQWGFGLLCAYPMSAFADETHRGAFRAVCDAHSHVDPLEQMEAWTVDPDRLHRTIACLQQVANSLESELARRRATDGVVARQAETIAAMERSQAALEALVGRDALTGLSNRRTFNDCVARAFARTERTQSRVALLFVDVDDFKALNDRFGHETGDRVLKEVGTRLSRCVRGSDTVCRLDGDEFTIVMEDAGADEAAALAQRVVDAFAEKVVLGAATIGLTVSVGIGLYPDDATDAETLIRSADKAMYRAKALGKGRHARPTTADEATHWMTVEAAALQLGLSRPHVAKLISEKRFDNVVHRHGALPLIPASEVSRVARQIRQA